MTETSAGGWHQPSGATTGLANYDLEGQRRDRWKRRLKRVVGPIRMGRHGQRTRGGLPVLMKDESDVRSKAVGGQSRSSPMGKAEEMNDLNLMLDALYKSTFSIMELPEGERDAVMVKSLDQFGDAITGFFNDSLSKAFEEGGEEALAKFDGGKLAKGMGTVAAFANVLRQVEDFLDGRNMFPAADRLSAEESQAVEQWYEQGVLVLRSMTGSDEFDEYFGEGAAAEVEKMLKMDQPGDMDAQRRPEDQAKMLPSDRAPGEDAVMPASTMEETTPEIAERLEDLDDAVEKFVVRVAKAAQVEMAKGNDLEYERGAAANVEDPDDMDAPEHGGAKAKINPAMQHEIEKAAGVLARRVIAKADMDDEEAEEAEEAIEEEAEKFAKSFCSKHLSKSEEEMDEEAEEEMAEDVEKFVRSIGRLAKVAPRRMGKSVPAKTEEADIEAADKAAKKEGEAVQKSAGGALRKSVDPDVLAKMQEQEAAIERLTKTVERLSGQPAPAKGALRAVDKGEDVTLMKGTDLAKEAARIDALTPEQRTHELMKLALSPGLGRPVLAK